MAFRMNRLHLVLPSGSRLAGRWPVAVTTLQGTKLPNCRFSRFMSSQLEPGYMYQHRLASFNAMKLRPRTQANFFTYLPQSNYASMRQQAFPMLQVCRNYSDGAPESPKSADSKSGQISGDAGNSAKAQSSTQRIKVILKEYGTVAFVFHISMSLCTLSVCYLLVSNGLDVNKVLEYFNFESSTTKKGASTFAISYLLYKMLLPVRATITIACVPIIVRSLRARGWMKGVAKAPTK